MAVPSHPHPSLRSQAGFTQWLTSEESLVEWWLWRSALGSLGFPVTSQSRPREGDVSLENQT